jgi:hypothetical protein
MPCASVLSLERPAPAGVDRSPRDTDRMTVVENKQPSSAASPATASSPAKAATQEDAPKDSQEQSATYAAGRPYVLPRACWRSPRTQRHTTVIA